MFWYRKLNGSRRFGMDGWTVHLHLGQYLYAKYQDPSQSCSSDILFTRLFLYKMPVSEKGE